MVVALLSSIAFVVWGAVKVEVALGRVALLFGGLGILLSSREMRRYMRPPKARDAWWVSHISWMLFAVTIALWVFSTVVLKELQPPWLAHSWPLLLGAVAACYWTLRYRTSGSITSG